MRKISQLVGLWIDRDTRSDPGNAENRCPDAGNFQGRSVSEEPPPVISEQNDSKETPNVSRKSSIVWPHGRSAT